MIGPRQVGIELYHGYPGNQGLTPIENKPSSVPVGISLSSGLVPPGAMMLWEHDTNGCPEGYSKKTGVASRYLNLTDDAGNVGATAASSTNHRHGAGGSCTSNSDVLSTYNTICSGEYSGYTAPSLSYPAIQYLACKKD